MNDDTDIPAGEGVRLASDVFWTDRGAPARKHPEQIGPYRIAAVLGQGGMGLVYLAHQESPKRTVALKVIKHGAESPEVRSRFRLEAEVLLRLEHPGIAQVYDVGTYDSPSGPEPYLAMEHVDGLRLTDYARRHRLSTRERLALLTQVCRAVHHAHQRGIVHRDLKPGNILVDAEGHCKILDFGLARLTELDVRITTLRTDIGRLLGTIPYMSPEQVAGNVRLIDFRSDVYSLGVIGYELLAGRLPYEVGHCSIPQAARMIQEADPTPLSSVSKDLRGDAETIIGKALEKEPSRRYQSAAELSADIERFMDQRPIAARPASTLYQMRKLVARHRVAAATLASLFAAITTFSIAMSVLYARSSANLERALLAESNATNEANTAQRVTEFMIDLFRLPDPNEALGSTITVREALDSAAQRLPDELEQEPVIRARLMAAIGAVYQNLGLYESAQRLFEGALTIRESTLGPEHPETARSLRSLGVLAYVQGRIADAEALHRRALEYRTAALGPSATEVAESINDLATAMARSGKYEEAEGLFRRALAMRRESLGPEHPAVGETLNSLATVLDDRSKFAEAEKCLREALNIRRKAFGKRHPSVTKIQYNLANLLTTLGRPAEAGPLYEAVYEIDRSVFGDDHPELARVLAGLGRHRMERGDYREAVPLFEKAVDLGRRHLGESHPNLGIILGNLGSCFRRLRDFDRAEATFREALAVERRAFGDDHPQTAMSLRNLAVTLRDRGRPDEAEPLLLDALSKFRQTDGEKSTTVAMLHEDLGGLASAKQDHAAAEGYMRKALELRSALLGEKAVLVAQSKANLASALLAQRKYAAAAELLRDSLAVKRRALGSDHLSVAFDLSVLSEVSLGTGDLPGAEQFAREALRIRRALVGDDHLDTGRSLSNLGAALQRQGKSDEAAAVLVEALAIFRGPTAQDPEPLLTRPLETLARVHLDRGDPTAAEPLLREAVELRQKLIPKDDVELAVVNGLLGQCLAAMGRFPEAEALLTESHANLVDASAPSEPLVRESRDRLVHLYRAWSKPDEAAKWSTGGASEPTADRRDDSP